MLLAQLVLKAILVLPAQKAILVQLVRLALKAKKAIPVLLVLKAIPAKKVILATKATASQVKL